jgi:VanZ family protein
MRKRLWRWGPVAAWLIVIFMGSSIGTLPSVDRGTLDQLMHWVGHLSEYAILALLLLRALKNGQAFGWREIVLTLIVAAVYGLSDEWHQTFVKGRNGELWTVGLDMAGALIGVVIGLWRQRNYHKHMRRSASSTNQRVGD